jgi:hypothetical protein
VSVGSTLTHPKCGMSSCSTRKAQYSKYVTLAVLFRRKRIKEYYS